MTTKLSKRAFLIMTLALCALVLTTGCRKKNPDGREDVTGTITINGQPLGVDGTSAGIRFDPVGDDKTAGGHGQITSGKFHLTQQDGVKPGKYVVRITGSATFDRKTGELYTPQTLMEDEYQVNLVPDEFNNNSTIEFEVVAKKKNVFDYDIVTDYKPSGSEKVPGKVKIAE